jgi:hypothetical protein
MNDTTQKHVDNAKAAIEDLGKQRTANFAELIAIAQVHALLALATAVQNNVKHPGF